MSLVHPDGDNPAGDGGEDSDGTPGEEGQEDDEQASGNPKNAG